MFQIVILYAIFFAGYTCTSFHIYKYILHLLSSFVHNFYAAIKFKSDYKITVNEEYSCWLKGSWEE